jgi:hypothetical protein
MKDEEKDPCVVCGKETGYARNVPVDMREFYVEGVGQLCEECDAFIYGKKSGEELGSRFE